MYEKFFKLREKPFEMVPNPQFLFPSKSHKKTMMYLDYGIKEKAGFILVTGEIGCGKTMLIRNLMTKNHDKVVFSKVFNTKVNSDQMISMINEDFGLNSAGKDKPLLLKDLYNFLFEKHMKGFHSVLIVDEAQNLTPELLEEIRMISNLETNKSKLIQIVLVGQPELVKILSMPELQQLRQRISVNSQIMPMSREETENYIFHRLEIAGNRNAVKFTGGSLDRLYSFSRGIPRLINIICDFLLLTAYTDETHDIDPDMVDDLADDLSFSSQQDIVKTTGIDKVALLKTLGVVDSNKQITFQASHVKCNDMDRNFNLKIADLRIKLAALEKEHVSMGSDKLDRIIKKIDAVERSQDERFKSIEISISDLYKKLKESENGKIRENESSNGEKKKILKYTFFTSK